MIVKKASWIFNDFITPIFIYYISLRFLYSHWLKTNLEKIKFPSL
ncbi:hypothetical protein ZPR_3977 [Zunongwangia profunda SM-A87]|uniref:Uncharacterized protein n=1 Tax=Zunongwangia profunda (strain DSM 18752 / CCTCC AB 206139 / SM-A87) TaxID=655815 RepID=D5B9G8_ZUNPS|nr:hypothetical protein ZPR_3977 [Zunongwangia profunda SM-A87]